MKIKPKNVAFVCQIDEDCLKIGKYLFGKPSERRFLDLYVEDLAGSISDRELGRKLSEAFLKLSWRQNPVILSLSRSKVTLRHIKVPTQIPHEIEKIAGLQASKYLPYPAEELITGYQVISRDEQGYSNVNLIIAHKEAVERYIRILSELKIHDVSVVVSSYGLLNLFNKLSAAGDETIMLLDVGYQNSELVIIASGKLLFSRNFKLDIRRPDWERILSAEINRTQEAYIKETAAARPQKLIILDKAKGPADALAESLRNSTGFIVEMMSYPLVEPFWGVADKIAASMHSFANILGFGLKDVEETLNLMPADVKERRRARAKQNEYLRSAALISVAAVLFFLGLNRGLDNKARYLNNLKKQMDKYSTQARYLEGAEKRLKAIEQRAAKKLSSLELLYDLHQVVPDNVSLTRVTYEESGPVILRGQTPELNLVFHFAGQLEKSEVFKNFSIKVKYATKRQTATGEVADFEIVCDVK